MILHFVRDEKIVDQIIDNFCSISANNHFLVFTQHIELKFITKKLSNVFLYDFKKGDINEIIKGIKPDAILVHSLHYHFSHTILQINKTIPIGWIAWGYDIYHLPKIRYKLYATNTKKFLCNINPNFRIESFIKSNGFIRMLYHKFIKRSSDYYSQVFKSIKKIIFFCTYIHEDFECLTNYYPNKLTYVNFSFNSINQYLGGQEGLRIFHNSNNVLLGNSNHIETNYLDALPLIAEIKDSINKVYTVLSYGENEIYKNTVIHMGERLIGSKFHPLTSFIPREQYIKLLQSCSVGIFHHYRQQAMGNIIAMLYMGSRVYLSEKNPSYRFFLRNNILVNKIESDFKIHGTSKLSSDEAEYNRKQLKLIFNEEKVLKETSNLITLLKSLV